MMTHRFLKKLYTDAIGFEVALQQVCFQASLHLRQQFLFEFVHYSLQVMMNRIVHSMLTINWRTPICVGFQLIAG